MPLRQPHAPSKHVDKRATNMTMGDRRKYVKSQCGAFGNAWLTLMSLFMVLLLLMTAQG